MSKPGKETHYLWPAGITSACCLSVDVDAEAPYLWQMRNEKSAYLAQLEQRRFGPRVGVWRLLDLANALEIQATFFIPALVAELHPDIAPAIIDRGHELGLHGYAHENPSEIDQSAFESALDASLELLKRQTGTTPVGFRSPGWEMTPGMISALKARGLGYDSSLMGFEHPYEIDGLIEVPVHWQNDDAVHFKFLGTPADRWPPASSGAILESWRQEWHALHETGGLFMLTVHPWIIGRAARIVMLSQLLREIHQTDGVWCASAAEIARYHASSSNAGRFAIAGAPLRVQETKSE